MSVIQHSCCDNPKPEIRRQIEKGGFTMKITINLSKSEAAHLKSPHSFMSECGIACDVLYKVQKAIDKKLKVKKCKR